MSVVVVTGAASGIGRATVDRCLREGRVVVALDRSEVGLADLAAAADADVWSDRLETLVCDVTIEHEVEAAFDHAHDAFGPISGLVTSAGVEANAELHLLTLETWDDVMGVNATGTFLTCKHAIARMLGDETSGSIVCLSSPAASVGFSGGGNGAYAASKGAISSLVRSLAVDYAPHGIRVNAVVPGATNTPLLLTGIPSDAREAAHAELVRLAAEQIPLQRMAEPSEIAQSITWLLSDDSSYVTGSHLVCDGGLLAKSANTF